MWSSSRVALRCALRADGYAIPSSVAAPPMRERIAETQRQKPEYRGALRTCAWPLRRPRSNRLLDTSESWSSSGNGNRGSIGHNSKVSLIVRRSVPRAIIVAALFALLGTMISRSPGDTGPATPRLQAPRHQVAIRRPRHRRRRGHRMMPSAPPLRRVQEVPHGHREGGAEGVGGPSGSRQLHDSQDRDDPQVASPTPPLPLAHHADQRVLAQLGRTLVRGDHEQADPARELPKHP